eukprot:14392425-Alexandrium_andersonii.AAC.1
MDVVAKSPEETRGGEPHGYGELEEAVAHWGVKRFEQFKGDIQIKEKNKVPLTQFEKDCSAVFNMLTAWVRHREEVSDDVIYLHSAVHQKQCPGSFDDDATMYAKQLQLVRWSQKQQTVVCTTVQQWLDGEEHERSSL